MKEIPSGEYRIADLATFDDATGYFHIRDVTFRSSTLVGPAVLAPHEDYTTKNIAWTAPGGFQGFFTQMPGDGLILAGIIILENVAMMRAPGDHIHGHGGAGPEGLAGGSTRSPWWHRVMTRALITPFAPRMTIPRGPSSITAEMRDGIRCTP